MLLRCPTWGHCCGPLPRLTFVILQAFFGSAPPIKNPLDQYTSKGKREVLTMVIHVGTNLGRAFYCWIVPWMHAHWRRGDEHCIPIPICCPHLSDKLQNLSEFGQLFWPWMGPGFPCLFLWVHSAIPSGLPNSSRISMLWYWYQHPVDIDIINISISSEGYMISIS